MVSTACVGNFHVPHRAQSPLHETTMCGVIREPDSGNWEADIVIMVKPLLAREYSELRTLLKIASIVLTAALHHGDP